MACCVAITMTAARDSEAFARVPQGSPIVRFTLLELPSERGGVFAWVATYGSEENVARFEIELEVGTAPPGTTPKIRGTLRRHSGSFHPNAFLADLVGAHGEEDVAVETPHRDSVSFVAAVVGAGLKPDSSPGALAGHFVEAPGGTWMLLQVVLEPQRSAAMQILVALSPETKEGALISAGRKFAPGVLSVFGGLLLAKPE